TITLSPPLPTLFPYTTLFRSLLASSLARRIPRFFVRGGRAARRPIPGPRAPSETTTAAAAESCTANAPVASPTLLYSYLRATMRSEEHTSELQSRRDLVCRLL